MAYRKQKTEHTRGKGNPRIMVNEDPRMMAAILTVQRATHPGLRNIL